MNCVIKIVRISVKKKEVNKKLNTKEGTYGHMSKKLKTIEIVALKLISPTFSKFILLRERFLQFDWLRAVVFQLNLQYLHVKMTTLMRVVV